jgi:hypothetical protein
MAPHPRSLHPVLRSALDPAHAELARSFTREAVLAAAGSPAAAAALASDVATVWLALCDVPAGLRPVSLTVDSDSRGIRAELSMQGHGAFAHLLPTLAARLQAEAGFSYRERGIDGWELTLRHTLDASRQVAHAAEAGNPQAVAGDFRIELPTQSDAPAIARCFLEVYGHHYPHAEVFAPARYWAQVERGELVPVIARNAAGTIVGHVALEREAGAPVAERGEAVVLRAYRGHQLLELMTKRLEEQAAALMLEGVFARPVTIHTFSQRNDVRIGMAFCAATLGLLPENILPKGLDVPTLGQRQSLLLAFRFLRPPPPRTVHAPPRYHEILAKIYGAIGADVAFAVPQTPAAAESMVDITLGKDGAGEIRFRSVGKLAATELRRMHRDMVSMGAQHLSLSLPLHDPGTPAVAEAARELGFFLSGLGPAFAQGSDALLLQYLGTPVDTGKLQIYSDQARELVASIGADRVAAGRS